MFYYKAPTQARLGAMRGEKKKWTTVKAVVEVPKEEINKCLAALEALHKNRSQADEALIAAIEHIATQLHRKIHGNDDNIIYSAEQRRGR
eukprot:g1.t1